MVCDFTVSENYGVWVVLAMAVLSHARGTVLLMREARSWFLALRRRRNNGTTPRL